MVGRTGSPSSSRVAAGRRGSPAARVSEPAQQWWARLYKTTRSGCTERIHVSFFLPFLPQKHILEAPFLHFWDFTVFVATASTLEGSPIQVLTMAQVG